VDAINAHLLASSRVAAYKGMSIVRPYDLQTGQILYRFIDVTRCPGPRVGADGPWWFEFEAFQQIKHFGLRNHYSLDYSARLHAAILYEWSEVTGVVRARLIQPLQAWKGRGKQVPSEGRDPCDLPTMTPMQGHQEVYQLFVPGIGGKGSLFPTAMQFLEYVSS
jgi:hypothetical protein